MGITNDQAWPLLPSPLVFGSLGGERIVLGGNRICHQTSNSLT